MREATLLLLFRGKGTEKELLLAMKKRGFGLDKWNGPGGKVDMEIGELPEECVVREAKEEVGLDVQEVELVGTFDFIFPHDRTKDFYCYLYTSETFTGEATESEEMRPQWFKVSEIPYDRMWDDDKIWLPLILQGKKLVGSFEFNEAGNVTKHNLNDMP